MQPQKIKQKTQGTLKKLVKNPVIMHYSTLLSVPYSRRIHFRNFQISWIQRTTEIPKHQMMSTEDMDFSKFSILVHHFLFLCMCHIHSCQLYFKCNSEVLFRFSCLSLFLFAPSHFMFNFLLFLFGPPVQFCQNYYSYAHHVALPKKKKGGEELRKIIYFLFLLCLLFLVAGWRVVLFGFYVL